MSVWSDNTAAAVAAIDAVLGTRGQWPGWVVMSNAPSESSRDMAAPLTALGMLCLRGVPGAHTVLDRSREHLVRTVLPGGVWRYYANITWDCDDTAMCALALGVDDPIVADTPATLARARTEQGLFYTWPDLPRDRQALDAVANAHVVAVLGPSGPIGETVAWLTRLVEAQTEVEHCCYYPDPLDTHMAIGRAVAAGVDTLDPALQMASARAVRRLDEPLSAYRAAQALVVALSGGVPAAALFEAGARLASMQTTDGLWHPDVLFTAVSTREFGGLAQYTSAAVTTALCAKALTMLEVS